MSFNKTDIMLHKNVIHKFSPVSFIFRENRTEKFSAMILYFVSLVLLSIRINVATCAVSNFENKTIEYKDGTTTLRGYLVYNPSLNSLRPAVVVVHDWDGRDKFENGKADALAELGYVGFALDLFGAVGRNENENQNLVKPFRASKELMLRRLQVSMDEVKKLAFVDQSKVAAIGFCFGGSAVLEMARNDFNVIGVVSFHGGLKAAEPASNSTMKAKVLALHGHEDPSILPKEVQEFEEEMTRRNVDWQVQVFGNHTYHAFMEPKANQPGQLQYQPISAKRSWISAKNFLLELFNM